MPYNSHCGAPLQQGHSIKLDRNRVLLFDMLIHQLVFFNLKVFLGFVLGGAATCSEGFVKKCLRVPQDVRLYCSCHAAQANMGISWKTYYKTFGTSGRPTL